MSTRTVDIPADVKEALKQFRFQKSKGNAAISGGLGCRSQLTPVRIVKNDLVMKVDEEFEDQDVEEIAEGELQRGA